MSEIANFKKSKSTFVQIYEPLIIWHEWEI